MAPGTSIYSTYLNVAGQDTYKTENGTSQAAPFVSGAIGLLKSIYPEQSNQDILSALKNNATVNQSGFNIKSGHGLLNISNTLKPLYTPSHTVFHTNIIEKNRGDQIVVTANVSTKNAIFKSLKLRYRLRENGKDFLTDTFLTEEMVQNGSEFSFTIPNDTITDKISDLAYYFEVHDHFDTVFVTPNIAPDIPYFYTFEDLTPPIITTKIK